MHRVGRSRHITSSAFNPDWQSCKVAAVLQLLERMHVLQHSILRMPEIPAVCGSDDTVTAP